MFICALERNFVSQVCSVLQSSIHEAELALKEELALNQTETLGSNKL